MAMKLNSRKRRIIILVSLFVIMADICVVFYIKSTKNIVVPVAKEAIVPLNHRIDNNMNLLTETQQLDREIERFMSKWDIKGASFAIMKDDKLLYAKGYGYANVSDNIKCDVRHLFRIASVSKLITAVAVMKLYEKKYLQLSDKVFGADGILNDSLFLNITDKRVKDITVEHLLRHQGGFSNRIGDPMFNTDIVARTLGVALPLCMNDMVAYASRSKLRTKPGAYTDYSNMGYLILSKVVEKVSGQDYERYVRDSVLFPIGCYDMHIGKNYESERRYNEVSYYEVHDAEPVEAFDGSGRVVMKCNGGNDVTGLYGAGGWIASPVELLRFIAAVDNNQGKDNILSSETIRLMTQLDKGELPIGWANVTTNNEWLRTGTLAGTSALIKRHNDGTIWAFVTNTSSWKGSTFPKYINSTVTKAINSVKEWPRRDLFVDVPNHSLLDTSMVTINVL